MDLSDYCTRRLAGLETGPIPDIGPSSAASIWALTGSATIFIILRFYCKIWRSRGLWWDDLVLVISWTIFLAAAIICQRVINYGFGRYPCDISPPSNFERIDFEGGALGSTCMILAIVWSKTSFGITILRLVRDRLRLFVTVLLVVMNVVMGLQAIFSWIKCSPVEKAWRPQTEGICWDIRISNGYGVFSGVLSGVCDLLFAFLPWTILWQLKMRTKEKIGVALAMSMGVFAGATAFVKAYHILNMGSKNFTHDGCYLITWAAAEISTTIMASCIPFLRVLFREIREATPFQISHVPHRRRYLPRYMRGQYPKTGEAAPARENRINRNNHVKEPHRLIVTGPGFDDTVAMTNLTPSGLPDSTVDGMEGQRLPGSYPDSVPPTPADGVLQAASNHPQPAEDGYIKPYNAVAPHGHRRDDSGIELTDLDNGAPETPRPEVSKTKDDFFHGLGILDKTQSSAYQTSIRRDYDRHSTCHHNVRDVPSYPPYPIQGRATTRLSHPNLRTSHIYNTIRGHGSSTDPSEHHIPPQQKHPASRKRSPPCHIRDSLCGFPHGVGIYNTVAGHGSLRDVQTRLDAGQQPHPLHEEGDETPTMSATSGPLYGPDMLEEDFPVTSATISRPLDAPVAFDASSILIGSAGNQGASLHDSPGNEIIDHDVQQDNMGYMSGTSVEEGSVNVNQEAEEVEEPELQDGSHALGPDTEAQAGLGFAPWSPRDVEPQPSVADDSRRRKFSDFFHPRCRNSHKTKTQSYQRHRLHQYHKDQTKGQRHSSLCEPKAGINQHHERAGPGGLLRILSPAKSRRASRQRAKSMDIGNPLPMSISFRPGFSVFDGGVASRIENVSTPFEHPRDAPMPPDGVGSHGIAPWDGMRPAKQAAVAGSGFNTENRAAGDANDSHMEVPSRALAAAGNVSEAFQQNRMSNAPWRTSPIPARGTASPAALIDVIPRNTDDDISPILPTELSSHIWRAHHPSTSQESVPSLTGYPHPPTDANNVCPPDLTELAKSSSSALPALRQAHLAQPNNPPGDHPPDKQLNRSESFHRLVLGMPFHPG
ncbi:hypothetical protein VTJ49DRAFT_5147 [Mycothermus thermophilus]|uniref:Rhodopsin domain-containing protein n=1 Tax=Humicola insolens TaxID=85995 RepID=A0ABR3V3T4_HUMIN